MTLYVEEFQAQGRLSLRCALVSPIDPFEPFSKDVVATKAAVDVRDRQRFLDDDALDVARERLRSVYDGALA